MRFAAFLVAVFATSLVLALGASSQTIEAARFSALIASPSDVGAEAATSTSLSAGSNTIPSGGTAALTATIATRNFSSPPTGTVTFFLNGATQLGTAPVAGATNPKTFLVQATATFVTAPDQLPPGKDTITASYSGDASYASSTGSTIVTLSEEPGFNLAIVPSIVDISAPGAQGTAVVTVTALNGFNGTIQLGPSACSGLPLLSTCSFNASAIIGSGSASVTISTTAPSVSALRGRPSSFGRSTPLAIPLVLLSWTALLVLCLQPRRCRLAAALGLVTLSLLLTLAACGGSGTVLNPGTPVGSDPGAMITLSSGSASSSITFTVDVMQ